MATCAGENALTRRLVRVTIVPDAAVSSSSGPIDWLPPNAVQIAAIKAPPPTVSQTTTTTAVRRPSQSSTVAAYPDRGRPIRINRAAPRARHGSRVHPADGRGAFERGPAHRKRAKGRAWGGGTAPVRLGRRPRAPR